MLGTKVDRLSKRLDWKVETENDNNNQTFIKEQWIYSLIEVVIEGPEVDILEKIKITRDKDEEIVREVVRVVEEMKKVGVKILQGDKQQIKGDLVLKKGKVYISKDEELRVEIIWLYYDVLVAEHRER